MFELFTNALLNAPAPRWPFAALDIGKIIADETVYALRYTYEFGNALLELVG